MGSLPLCSSAVKAQPNPLVLSVEAPNKGSRSCADIGYSTLVLGRVSIVYDEGLLLNLAPGRANQGVAGPCTGNAAALRMG